MYSHPKLNCLEIAVIINSKKGLAERESDQITLRVRRVLEVFQILPDDALVERRVVSAVLGRSAASTWRDAAHGRLAQPIHIGRSARWRVGDVRIAMKGGHHA